MLISTQTSHLNSSPSGSTDLALEEAAEGLGGWGRPKPGLPLGSSPAVAVAEAEPEVPRLSLRARAPLARIGLVISEVQGVRQKQLAPAEPRCRAVLGTDNLARPDPGPDGTPGERPGCPASLVVWGVLSQ